MPHFAANLSLLFREYPLIDRFGAARAAGFEAVEIQFPYELPVEAIRRELDLNELDLVLINVPGPACRAATDWPACRAGNRCSGWA